MMYRIRTYLNQLKRVTALDELPCAKIIQNVGGCLFRVIELTIKILDFELDQ